MKAHIDMKKSAQHSAIWCAHRWSTTIIAGTKLWRSHSHHATISEEITILWCWCEPRGLLRETAHVRTGGASNDVSFGFQKYEQL